MCCQFFKYLADHGHQTSINKMIEAMNEIKRIETIFGDISTVKKLSATLMDENSPNKSYRYTS
jgi:hypothetical protein